MSRRTSLACSRSFCTTRNGLCSPSDSLLCEFNTVVNWLRTFVTSIACPSCTGCKALFSTSVRLLSRDVCALAPLASEGAWTLKFSACLLSEGRDASWHSSAMMWVSCESAGMFEVCDADDSTVSAEGVIDDDIALDCNSVCCCAGERWWLGMSGASRAGAECVVNRGLVCVALGDNVTLSVEGWCCSMVGSRLGVGGFGRTTHGRKIDAWLVEGVSSRQDEAGKLCVCVWLLTVTQSMFHDACTPCSSDITSVTYIRTV